MSTSTSRFEYNAGDDVLNVGSAKFIVDNSYAGMSTEPVEVMGSTVPVTFDVSGVVYRVRVNQLQPARNHTIALRYTVVPRLKLISGH